MNIVKLQHTQMLMTSGQTAPNSASIKDYEDGEFSWE